MPPGDFNGSATPPGFLTQLREDLSGSGQRLDFPLQETQSIYVRLPRLDTLVRKTVLHITSGAH